MTKSDLLLALKSKPVPFTTPSGVKVDLRPISVPERMATLEWWEANKGEPAAGWNLMAKYVALGLCDGNGEPMFTEGELATLPISAADFDAIGKEVARRAGLIAGEADPKASPATPS